MCSSAVNLICMFPLSHQSCLVNFWMPLCGAYSLGVVATGCLEMWETDVRWGGVCWPSIFFGETHLKSRHGFIKRIHPCPETFCLGRFFLKSAHHRGLNLQEEGSFATKTISNARLLTAFRYSFGIGSWGVWQCLWLCILLGFCGKKHLDGTGSQSGGSRVSGVLLSHEVLSNAPSPWSIACRILF